MKPLGDVLPFLSVEMGLGVCTRHQQLEVFSSVSVSSFFLLSPWKQFWLYEEDASCCGSAYLQASPGGL